VKRQNHPILKLFLGSSGRKLLLRKSLYKPKMISDAIGLEEKEIQAVSEKYPALVILIIFL
jgi:hypothetical protein